MNKENNIRELRLKKGLSARKLSQSANLSMWTIYGLESGKLKLCNSKFDTITKLCNALQCHSVDLFK